MVIIYPSTEHLSCYVRFPTGEGILAWERVVASEWTAHCDYYPSKEHLSSMFAFPRAKAFLRPTKQLCDSFVKIEIFKLGLCI